MVWVRAVVPNHISHHIPRPGPRSIVAADSEEFGTIALKPIRIYYGWLVVAAASGIGFANAATAIGILTIFVIPMSQEFGWNRTQVAGATSLGAILGAALAPFSGRLVDRIGSRALLTLGGLTVVLACGYLALAQTLAGFYAAFTVARIADQGLIKIGTSPTIGKWFSRYRGRATGIAFFSEAAGLTLMAPLVQLVISAAGWRSAWLMLGGSMLVLGVIPCAWLIRRQPEDLGLLPDGDPAYGLAPELGSGAEASGDRAPESPTRTGVSSTEQLQPPPLAEIIRAPSFWLVLVSLFVVSTATSGVGLHLVPHLIQRGLTPLQAIGAISVMSISGAVGSLLLGFLAERLPPLYLLAAIYLLGAISMMVLINADDLPKTYVFAIIQGITGSGVNTLAPLIWASYYGRAFLGSIFGISRAAQVAGFAVGPLASGIVYDVTGSYQQAFIYFAGLALVSSVLILAAHRPMSPR